MYGLQIVGGHKTHGCWPWTRLDSGAAGINWGLQCAESAPLAFPCRPLQPGKALRQPLAGECAAALHVPANAAAAAVTSACEHADHCTRYWSVVSQCERASLLRRRHAGGRWSCPAPSSAFTTSGPPSRRRATHSFPSSSVAQHAPAALPQRWQLEHTRQLPSTHSMSQVLLVGQDQQLLIATQLLLHSPCTGMVVLLHIGALSACRWA